MQPCEALQHRATLRLHAPPRLQMTFVGPGFTRKPPKYERFIRPTGLRITKAHVTHPELKATFCLDIIGIKKNPNGQVRARGSCARLPPVCLREHAACPYRHVCLRAWHGRVAALPAH